MRKSTSKPTRVLAAVAATAALALTAAACGDDTDDGGDTPIEEETPTGS